MEKFYLFYNDIEIGEYNNIKHLKEIKQVLIKRLEYKKELFKIVGVK